jgi:hypothetical protein
MEVTETEVMIITAQISFLNWVGLNRFRMLRDGSWKSSKLDKKAIDTGQLLIMYLEQI